MFQKTVGFRVFFWASVVVIGGFVFLPLLWLINTALKPASETFSLAFPQAILLLSIYVLMQKLGLLGSYYALMISYVVFTLPVGTWTLKTYFDQLPDSLIESAKIDGAGNFRIMWKIIFPMAAPGMVSIAIYGFVWSWNDLLYSMTLVTDTAKRTLASGLVMTFLGEASTNWDAMMAASVVSAVPVTIVFIFLQRYFIAGLTSGAGKG